MCANNYLHYLPYFEPIFLIPRTKKTSFDAHGVDHELYDVMDLKDVEPLPLTCRNRAGLYYGC